MPVGHVLAELLLFCGEELPEALLGSEGPGGFVPAVPRGRRLALHADLPRRRRPAQIHPTLICRVHPDSECIDVHPRNHMLLVQKRTPVSAGHPADDHGVPGVEPMERRGDSGGLGPWGHTLDGAGPPVPLLLASHRDSHCVLLVGIFDGRLVRSRRGSTPSIQVLHVSLPQRRLLPVQQLLHGHFRTPGKTEDCNARIPPS
mmetsp:Transcript_88350/g.236107  ORF Transcript_88350/g.236107 Transcript_88350/m.236107 type:complete len:202 (-) Transcript_88350:315-920(-)